MDTFLDTALSRKYRSNLWCKWINTNFRPMLQSALLSVVFVVVLIKPNNIMEGVLLTSVQKSLQMYIIGLVICQN